MTDVNRRQRVGVGLSGGVDSAAAALRLCRSYPDKTGKQILAQIEGERNGR